MLFYRKKVSIKEFCNSKCDFIFSEDARILMDNLLNQCDNKAIIIGPMENYYRHFIAAYLQLLGIALAKNCSMEIGLESNFIINDYLESRGLHDIKSFETQYNSAFGSSPVDGIIPMVNTFIYNLTGSEPNKKCFKIFYEGYYSILSSIFDEIRKIKLVL